MRKVGRYRVGQDFECIDTPTGRAKGMSKLRETIRGYFRSRPDTQSAEFQKSLQDRLDFYFGLREKNKAIIDLQNHEGFQDLMNEIEIRHENEAQEMPGGVLRLYLNNDPSVVVTAIEHLLFKGFRQIIEGAGREYEEGEREIDELLASVTRKVE